MRLLTFVLGLAAVLLIGLEYGLDARWEAQRQRQSLLRPLPNLPLQQVAAFQVRTAGQTWTYVRRRGHWRFPAYHEAFVLDAQVDQLLGGLQRLGTVVSTEPGDMQRFGLHPARAVVLLLRDSRGHPLDEIWLGRRAPGAAADEAYVKRAGADTIYHLHANPRRALGRGVPPMLDPHVLPRALERKSIVRMEWEAPAFELSQLRRLELRPALVPGRPPQGPSIVWLSTFAGREDTCLSANAFAFTGFLTRLRYAALHDAAGDGYGFNEAGPRLLLQDEDGREDVLEVGVRDGQGNRFLRLRTTGQVFSLAADKADLLFPGRAALIDSLPQPDPYQVVEPQARGVF